MLPRPCTQAGLQATEGDGDAAEEGQHRDTVERHERDANRTRGAVTQGVIRYHPAARRESNIQARGVSNMGGGVAVKLPSVRWMGALEPPY